MKNILKGALVTASLIFGCITASLAQSVSESEKLEIPLSTPGKSGSLKVNIISGSIRVFGYMGKEVVVTYSPREGRQSSRQPETNSEGLRRIPNNNIGLEVQENNNVVSVRTSSHNRTTDLTIKVPFDFSLNLKTLNNGVIEVEDVNGELDIDNLNGSITLKDVSGSASVSTLNGNITANFKKITPNVPMAFSNMNGKIDISMPASAKFNVKMKSDNGEIFSDFDMAMEKARNVKEEDSKSHRVYVDKWLTSKINGGGPELLFKNFNGNIYIRKNK